MFACAVWSYDFMSGRTRIEGQIQGDIEQQIDTVQQLSSNTYHQSPSVMSPQYWLLAFVVALLGITAWRSISAHRLAVEKLADVSDQAVRVRIRVSVRYRLADLIGIRDDTWRRRLGWSPLTYLRTAALTVRDRSAQVIPARPRYIAGVGREFYFDPHDTRILVSRFRGPLAPSTGAPFVVFSRLEPDGSRIDLVAITHQSRLDEIQEALKAVGFRTDGAPVA
jgi:hypothetical protein